MVCLFIDLALCQSIIISSACKLKTDYYFPQHANLYSLWFYFVGVVFFLPAMPVNLLDHSFRLGDKITLDLKKNCLRQELP
jgi:hypothetical protein